jgi:predicted DsbA family dithiol-disulfide isomerase
VSPVQVLYFSDILCVWAYCGQRRVEQLAQSFGDQLVIETRFCSVFGDARAKIEAQWRARGGYDGFGAHVCGVAENFPHINIHPRLWRETRPRTSTSAHLFIKAVELIEADLAPAPYLERLSTRAAAALRAAFFVETRDIADWDVHAEIAADLGLDYRMVEARIRSSEAVALLIADYDLAAKHGVLGSPAFVMNEGRQKLIGNVGYRLIEANVRELRRTASMGEASWC